jgi:CubicO group peptidase (beta-lactamase class C family)
MRRTRSARWPSLLVLAVALVACGPIDAGPVLDTGPDAALDAGEPVDAFSAPDVGHDAGPIPADLEGFIGYQMRLGRLPGVAAAIVDRGAIQRIVTLGRATDTTNVDAHTLFLVASISKTFVSALLLQLAEEGTLTLDDAAETYLGYPVRAPQAPDHAITIRELATHTSGLTDDWPALGTVTTTGDPTVTLTQFAHDYLMDPTHFDRAPGVSQEYCNAGFGVLGAVIEAASHEDLRARTARLLTTPLALDGAGWWLADVDTSHLAVEYVTGVVDPATGDATYEAQPQRGFGHYTATSMRISITDLARWVLMHTGGGTLDGATVLMPTSIGEEQHVQYPALDRDQGFVWYYRNLDGARWISHSGSSFGTSAQMMYRTTDGRGLIVITNSDAYIRSRFGRREGADAIEAILTRLDQEADAIAAMGP